MTAEWAEQPGALDNGGIPGRTLAAQREALGWSVEQVADQLKLAVRQVVALEAGDYANLPGPAVVRGFVRAYAKILKLDPAPLVAQIALDNVPAPDTTPSTVRRDKPASFSEVRFPSNGKRARLPLGLLAGVVVLAAIGVGIWQSGLISTISAAGGSAPATATAPVPATEGNVTMLPSPVNGAPAAAGTAPSAEHTLQSPSVPLISVPPQTPAGAAAGSPATGTPPATAPAPAPAVAPATAAAPAPAAAPAAAGANALVLTVREDSWIQVKPAKGKPLLSKMVKAGSVEAVDIKEPVTLVVGKPENVQATLRGAPVALPRVPGGTVSRVPLE
ncbi:MAG: helix-turn-helix domain-containing protein [Gammaproteobacteria bacterium]